MPTRNITRKQRKGPSESATSVPEGTILRGNDKQRWVVKKTSAGIRRWVPMASAQLFGFAPLTVDYMAKHIGKTIVFYEREYSDTWPKSTSKMLKNLFIPTGDAIVGHTKRLSGWLKTKRPPIQDDTIFTVEGDLNMYPTQDPKSFEMLGVQVDSVNKTLASNNITNSEAFVKV